MHFELYSYLNKIYCSFFKINSIELYQACSDNDFDIFAHNFNIYFKKIKLQ